MSSIKTIKGYRAGFLFVVFLLAADACFTLWVELRTNQKEDLFVSQALERNALIGRIRVDALNLEAAVDGHIRGTSDEERAAADLKINPTLEDIDRATADYTKDLAPGAHNTWNEFNATCKALAAQVHTAVGYSRGRESARARQHLVEKIRPISATLDQLASKLSTKNAVETSELLHNIEELRLRGVLVGAVVAILAIAVSLLVGWRASSLVEEQDQTIREQLGQLNLRNHELDAFASRVAHDLVSPLAPLKGYLTLIRRSPSVNDPQIRDLLSQAESSASRMSELIEALLRFCRAGNRAERSVSELDTAVSTVLLEIDQSASLQGVKIERHLEQGVPVGCPTQLLQSIAQNLLSNAVKYSAGQKDAKVTVKVYRERAEAVLEVVDNGIGMSEQTVRSLFQPFFRATETRALPGHGLGLATTKRLVEAYGGTIGLRSQVNVGTQVTVRLPIASGAPIPAGQRARAADPSAAPAWVAPGG